jgi:Bacterial Ig domain
MKAARFWLGHDDPVFLSTTIQASASDNRGVTQVVFYDGANVIGTDTTAPYSLSWTVLENKALAGSLECNRRAPLNTPWTHGA